MPGTLTRRQQARNEKALQDLVSHVPGNNQCADCHARNPAWASWSLGVFLCMRCAAIHRKLGTHVSKVKSLSMDSWSNEQVDNMRKVGNIASNQIYNPEGRKPPTAVDIDETDSAMERFIRRKYTTNLDADSRKESPSSDEGTPPPLPPKNSAKFGLRSASSIFPLSSRAKREQRIAAGANNANLPSPTLSNKPSKVFGSSIDYDACDDVEKKLQRLHEMGFQDSRHNAAVLKGVNGNLGQAIETLIRLGEGRSRTLTPAQPMQDPTLRTSRSMTPMASSGSSGPGVGFGLGSSEASTSERPLTSSITSTNPFDAGLTAQPQTAHSTGTLHHKNPYNINTNPFNLPSRNVEAVSQAFQGLDISSSLAGGGHQAVIQSSFQGPPAPSLHQQQQQQQQQQQFEMLASSSAPPSPQDYMPMKIYNSTMQPRATLQGQQDTQTQTFYNAFIPQPASPASHIYGLSTGTMQGGVSSNPFLRSPTVRASPSLGKIPESNLQSSVFQTPSYMALQPNTPPSANFSPSIAQQQLLQQQPLLHGHQLGQQSSTFQEAHHQQNRQDKASILALYSQYSQPAQTLRSNVPAAPDPITNNVSIPEGDVVHVQSTNPFGANIQQQPRSVSQPAIGKTNPFSNPNEFRPNTYDINRRITRESLGLGLDMAWTNGRHSPDAFSSLSAKHA